MKTLPVYSIEGELLRQEEIPDELIEDGVNQDVLYYYVAAYRANQRQGTASTKTPGEVSGSGRKPWRQKGTGRARAGNTRSALWRHGGTLFGPKPRDYRVNLPRKVKRSALREALKDKVVSGRIAILSIESVEKPLTKPFAAFLRKIEGGTERVLFVVNRDFPTREALVKSVRNIANADLDYGERLNAYDILRSDRLVVAHGSFPVIRKYLGADNDS